MSLTCRRLGPEDAGLLDAFLAPHTVEAYYLHSNMKAAGLVYEGKFHQAEYVGAFAGDRMVGVLSYSWLDTILLYAQDDACIPLLAACAGPLLSARGGVIHAILGLAGHVDRLLECLSVPAGGLARCDNDGLFLLDVPAMKVPACAPDMYMRLAEEKDKETLIRMRVDFNVEAVCATRGPALQERVTSEITERLIHKDMFVLEQGGQVIGYCGLTGSFPSVKMFGPLWIEPDYRGKGFGKLATVLSIRLVAAQSAQLKQVVLFASRPDAVRVYESIGFRRVADWRLAVLKDHYRWQPQAADGCADSQWSSPPVTPVDLNKNYSGI